MRVHGFWSDKYARRNMAQAALQVCLFERACLQLQPISLLLHCFCTSLHVLARSACGEVRGYDGSEDCLLLQTCSYVFTWEFLMRYSAAVTSNEKVTFYGFWYACPYPKPA